MPQIGWFEILIIVAISIVIIGPKDFPYVLKNTGDGRYGKYVIAQTSGKTGNPANVSTYIDKSVDTNLEFLIDKKMK